MTLKRDYKRNKTAIRNEYNRNTFAGRSWVRKDKWRKVKTVVTPIAEIQLAKAQALIKKRNLK